LLGGLAEVLIAVPEWSLVGKCGVFCGACRLYVIGRCRSCTVAYAGGGAGCPYFRCVEERGLRSCGDCEEFPCEKHYGPMAVYSKTFLDWRKREIKPDRDRRGADE